MTLFLFGVYIGIGLCVGLVNAFLGVLGNSMGDVLISPIVAFLWPAFLVKYIMRK